ncbi:MAG: hypothetical protein ACRCYQ_03485 [Nocardioides sp.]
MDLGAILGRLDTDQMGDAVELVIKHQGSLEVLAALPGYLDKIADALAGAGAQSRAAALALVGEGGQDGVRDTMRDAAGALGEIASSVSKGVERIAEAAEGLGRVPLMDGPSKKLVTATTDLGGSAERLGELAVAMNTIGDTLGAVGEALAKLGDRLGESGAHTREFVESFGEFG